MSWRPSNKQKRRALRALVTLSDKLTIIDNADFSRDDVIDLILYFAGNGEGGLGQFKLEQDECDILKIAGIYVDKFNLD
jgi:hypothetical protein